VQVEEFLEHGARRLPSKTALVFEGSRWTYSELEERANRLAHALMAFGVHRGDRVAIYLQNSPEAVIAIFGALKAGGVFVVIHPTTKADKLAYVLRDSGAAALILPARSARALSSVLAGAPGLRAILLAGGGGAAPPGLEKRTASFDAVVSGDRFPAARPGNACIDIDLAALVYTSGSTGTPKGVMLTHLNMVSAATSITTYLGNTEDDVILDVLPLSFDYGLYQVLMAFKIGAAVVLERSFAYPQVILQRIAQERVTGFPVLPTILAILFQLDLTRHDLSSLRYITNTGAALPVAQIQRLRALFPEVKIFSMYGLTECKRVSYLPPDQIDVRPTSVGKAIPNEEVYIVDEAGNRVGPGVTGELVVRGSNVMKGYWGLPQETEKVLGPGPLPGERVLHTGDLFRMDDEGYLYFVARKDDIIKSRGEKVSPREVENVLYRLEEIAEAAVVGVADPVLGEAIKAVVRPRDGVRLTERDVLRHCSKHLESYMIPSLVEFRSDLPRTDTGKIDKLRLS
jgi:amino acid adenylation domain-containing protein